MQSTPPLSLFVELRERGEGLVSAFDIGRCVTRVATVDADERLAVGASADDFHEIEFGRVELAIALNDLTRSRWHDFAEEYVASLLFARGLDEVVLCDYLTLNESVVRHESP